MRLEQAKEEHRSAVGNLVQASRTVPRAPDAVEAALVELLIARARLAQLLLEVDDQSGRPVIDRQALLAVHVESIVATEETLLDMRRQA